MKTADHCIILLKQTSRLRNYFLEMGTDLAETIGPCLMYTSMPRDQQIGALTVISSPAYDNSSESSRLLSWLRYFVGAGWQVLGRSHTMLLFIVAQPPFLPLWGVLCRLLFGQRYIVWIDDVYPDVLVRRGRIAPNGIVCRVWGRANRLFLRHADEVTTLGPRMAEVVAQYMTPEAAQKIRILTTPVDTDFIQPIKKDSNTFAMANGQVDKMTVLYSGNLGLSHDLDMMVDVAERLRERDEIHFLIIGSGPGWQVLFESAKSLDNMTVLPLQDDDVLPLSLSTGDVSWVSIGSNMEGISMPSKTQYALAAGSAILGVSPSSSDLHDIVERYDCGITVEPGDADGCVDAICRLASDPDLLSRCRKNARQAAVREFSRRANLDRLLAMVNPLLTS